jgi:hypothetical protein
MLSLVPWLENHMMPCFYKQLTGIDCPGCGMQRSFIELLKGNFIASFKIYPALLPVMITLGITASHLFFKFKNGAAVIKYSFIFTTGIVVLSYILKLLR